MDAIECAPRSGIGDKVTASIGCVRTGGTGRREGRSTRNRGALRSRLAARSGSKDGWAVGGARHLSIARMGWWDRILGTNTGNATATLEVLFA